MRLPLSGVNSTESVVAVVRHLQFHRSIASHLSGHLSVQQIVTSSVPDQQQPCYAMLRLVCDDTGSAE